MIKATACVMVVANPINAELFAQRINAVVEEIQEKDLVVGISWETNDKFMTALITGSDREEKYC